MDDTPGRIAELERRVATLERRKPPGRGAAAARPDLSQLEHLRRRRGPAYVRGQVRGAVVYAGAVRIGKRESLWIKERGVPEILDLDPPELARVMASLAHPVRLNLARALLEAPRTSQELQEVLGTASAGQLYHHLKEMVAAGVVHQAGRSRYEITAEHSVPLLALLATAGDLLRAAGGDGSPPSKDQEE